MEEESKLLILRKSIDDLTTQLRSDRSRGLILPGASIQPSHPIWTPGTASPSSSQSTARPVNPSLILPGDRPTSVRPLALPPGTPPARNIFTAAEDAHKAAVAQVERLELLRQRTDPKDIFARAELNSPKPKTPNQPPGKPPAPPATQPPPKPGDKPEEDAKKKSANGFAALTGSMGKFAASLVGVGVVMKGLSGTREQYLLNYSIQHLFHEIANLLRNPIRLITRELEGLAHVLQVWDAHDPNAGRAATGAAIGASIAGVPGAAVGAAVGEVTKPVFDAGKEIGRSARQLHENMQDWEQNAFGNFNKNWPKWLGGGTGNAAEDRANKKFTDDAIARQHGWKDAAEANSTVPEAQARTQRLNDAADWIEKAKKTGNQAEIARALQEGNDALAGKPKQEKPKDDRLQPMMNVSFGDVAGLQQRMQQLVTENPAQEKGLSLIEQIAKAVMTMAYGKEDAEKMFPDPSYNPAVVKKT